MTAQQAECEYQNDLNAYNTQKSNLRDIFELSEGAEKEEARSNLMKFLKDESQKPKRKSSSPPQ